MSHSDDGSAAAADAARVRDAGGQPADGEVGRRRLAAGLALGLAIAMVVVPVVQILLLTDAGHAGEGVPGRWSLIPSTLAEAAPWFIGSVLLQMQRIRLATAVLITAAAIHAVLALPLLFVAVFSLPLLLEMFTEGQPWPSVIDLVVRLGFAAVAVGIAWLVWRSRTGLAPEPRRAVPRFVGVAAGLVALSAVFVRIVPLAPSSRMPVDGWFPTTVGTGQFSDPSIALWTALPALLAIGVAVAAYRIGGDVAGAVLLTFAGPQLVSEVTTHVVNVTAFDGMITPVGGLVLIGLAALVAAGLSLLGPEARFMPAEPVGPRPPSPSGRDDGSDGTAP